MNNIILIGMMGSGKSTLSHLLYSKTKYQVVDCDADIETSMGMSITEIFDIHGQAYFRDLEKKYLANFNKGNCIISTGGGMILSQENRSKLSKLGKVFYLSASVETLYQRLIAQTENRPLLSGQALQEQLTDLLIKRENLYIEAADYVVSIDNKTADQVVLEIYTILSELDYNFLT